MARINQKRDTTEQTKVALRGNVKGLEYQSGRTEDYFYGILSNNTTDPYANFREFFIWCARNKFESVQAYLDDLRTIFAVELERQGRGETKPSGGVPCLHRELNDVIASALGNKPATVQQREIHEAIDCLTARLALLEDHGERVN